MKELARKRILNQAVDYLFFSEKILKSKKANKGKSLSRLVESTCLLQLL
jgi:hypothetical protein